MMKSIYVITIFLISSNVFAVASQPNQVTCFITLASGSNPETGEGGTRVDNSMILQADGPNQYNLYYVLGGDEYTLAKGLSCNFAEGDRSLYTCSKLASGTSDCVHVDSGRFSRSIVVNRQCSESIGVRVRETTFIQTERPEQSGGCFAE